MHSITPLNKVPREAVERMAEAAFERGDLLDDANVFPPDTNQRRQFRSAYLKLESARAPVTV